MFRLDDSYNVVSKMRIINECEMSVFWGAAPNCVLSDFYT